MNKGVLILLFALTVGTFSTVSAQTVPVNKSIPTEKTAYAVPEPQDKNETQTQGTSPYSPSNNTKTDRSSTSSSDLISQEAATADSAKSSTAEIPESSSAPTEKSASVSSAAMAAASSGGTSTAQIPTLNSVSVQVQPFTGSASLPIAINVPAGRAGIQPSVALVYSSGLPESFTGVGWNLDLGSIQRSTKKGPPKYDSTDTYVLMQNGSSSNLVYDSTAGYYRQEIEGAFAKIAKSGSYWIMTDKKGTKYFFGQTAASQQADPASSTKIFEWALDRVEDISGNYMTITYTKPGNELLPDTIQYTGNTGQSIAPFTKVVFTYMNAGRTLQSYKSSFLVSSSKLLDAVSVYGSNVLLTKYKFTYQQSVSSKRYLLTTVQQYGANGTSTLPSVTFSYQGAEKGFTTPPEKDWSVPVDGAFVYQESGGRAQDRGVRIADMNGDAYPDLVRKYTSCNDAQSQATYLNTKNRGFQLASGWAIPSHVKGFIRNCPNMDYANGLQLVDVDGDMWVDAIRNYKRDPSYGNAFYVQTLINDKAGNFPEVVPWFPPTSAAVIFQLGLPANEYSEYEGVVYGDVNGDSYTDIVVSKVNGNANHTVYINQAVNGGTGWLADPTWTTPNSGYSDFAQGAVLADLNGDGLADIVHLDGSSGKVYMNNGHGWVDGPTPWDSSPISTARLTTGVAQFADVNGDGLADVVVGDGDYIQVMINTGSGWFDDSSSWSAPSGYFNRLDQRMLDANADGVVDYMYSLYGYTTEMYMNKSKPADLLVKVNNGIGGNTEITYESSAHYSNTFLPFIVQVVKSVEVSTASESYTTNYSYANGLWAADGREFRGFGLVTVTDPDGNYVKTTYLQDKIYKGMVSSQETYNAEGDLFGKTVNTWASKTIMTNNVSVFPFLKRVDQFVYDGNATGKRSAQEFFYDEATQYGNLTKTVEYGEVDLANGSDNPSNDKRTTESTYLNNSTLWLLGLPKQVTIKDHLGNMVRQTSFYYDNNAGLSDVPTKGRLTKRVRWAGASATAHPTDLYSYDATGNLLTTTDPNNNVTTITYDPLKLFPLTTKNALNHVVATEYYGINGVALDDGAGLVGLWGQVKSVTDANNQKAKRVYDTFGRITKSISPLDSVTYPTTSMSYLYTSAYFSVTSKQRPVCGNSATIDSVQYYDGLGRLIQTKTETATAGQYIIGGQTQYNSRGLPQYKYVPRFTSNALTVMDPVVTSQPRVKIDYDAMGRALKTTNPDGTYSNAVYDDWSVAQYDERGARKDFASDAYGRVWRVREFSGYDGRSAQYPQSDYVVYAATHYTYDKEGNLTIVTDTQGNSTSIDYDSLGRKISMDDPDMGVWFYTYDLSGNLLTQKDAKNQTITFAYDALNRLKKKVSGTTVNVTYTYDDTVNSGYAKGRLSKVDYTGGSTRFVYDVLGRETQSVKAIDGVSYSVSRVYDNLNNVTRITYPDASQVFYQYNSVGQLNAISNDSTVLPSLVSNTQRETPKSMFARIRDTWGKFYVAWMEPYVFGIKEADAAVPATLFVQKINYNANGQKTRIEFGNGVVTVQDYDPLMFRLKRIYTTKSAAVLQDLNYTYDAVGNILAINDVKNTADQSFTYDALSRLKTAGAPATYGTQSYSYDEIGNIKAKEGVTFTYSGVNAGPHAVTSLNDGTTIGYDGNGNMTSMVKTGANNVYTYDTENRLIDVRKNGSTVAQYFYDGDGGRTRKISYTTGEAGNNTCFLAGTKISMSDGTTKNIEDIKVGDIVASYDEKKMANVSAKVTEMFDGERATAYLLINGSLKVTPNHQFYSEGKWVEIGKMKEGDILLDQDLKEVVIEKIEKVETQNEIQVYNLEVEAEHNYYANGILVHNKLSYNPPAVSGVPVTSGVMTNYVGSLYEETKGVGVNSVFLGSTKIATVSSNQVRFYFQDHLGGANVVTNSAGTQIELIEYKPFGGFAKNVKSSGVENVAWEYFTGKTLDDETGLIFFGARYYSPIIGRFITPDTLVQAPHNPQTLNRYTYCNNNPINLIDLDGHKWSWTKFFTSAIGAVVGVALAIVSAGVLAPAIGVFWAGVVGGALGGAVGGGLTTALQGGSWSQIGMSALMGGAFGAVGGGFGASSLSNLTKGIIGGIALTAGAVYAAKTDNLDNFAGALVGGYGGYAAGTRITTGKWPWAQANQVQKNSGTNQTVGNEKNTAENVLDIDQAAKASSKQALNTKEVDNNNFTLDDIEFNGNADAIRGSGKRFFSGFKNRNPSGATVTERGDFVQFSVKVPANNIPGSYTEYFKTLNSQGETIRFYHDTYGAQGQFVSRAIKLPGPERHIYADGRVTYP